MQVKRITKTHAEYPELLRNIFIPPHELFVTGNILVSDSNAIAIVGTRRATLYGLEQCEKLSFDLALRGITIISGMARGIDTAAHRGAIKARGRTIAVLGSGHNDIYPRENRKLCAEIAKNGAVISEFPPDTPPYKLNFPKRNRIISGMSKGVVVVEAPRKSGALITANFALQQGREVFAMPGNISSMKSSGTNALIKEGAKLITGVSDILEELKLIIDTKEISAPLSATEKRSRLPLSSEENTVLDIVDDRPKSIDEISIISDIPVYQISTMLVSLELKRLIKMLPGENFVRV